MAREAVVDMSAAAPMARRTGDRGRRAAKSYLRRIVIWAGVFSIFVNLLLLTGPLFMLQVYDRVLSSGSLPTLAALFALVAVLFLFMGLLDLLRGRLLARAGARLESLFERRLFKAAGQSVIVIAHRPSAIAACDDLLVLQDGLQIDLGPREEVLGRSVKNGDGLRRRLQLVGRRR